MWNLADTVHNYVEYMITHVFVNAKSWEAR